MRLIDADKLIEKIDGYTRTNNVEFNIACKYIIEVVKEQPTAFDVDKRDTQLELHTIKLLTLGAKAYATWFDIITSKMRGNDEIAKLFLELPTVQGTSNIMALERLKDSQIDVDSITSLEDVIKAIDRKLVE